MENTPLSRTRFIVLEQYSRERGQNALFLFLGRKERAVLEQADQLYTDHEGYLRCRWLPNLDVRFVESDHFIYVA